MFFIKMEHRIFRFILVSMVVSFLSISLLKQKGFQQLISIEKMQKLAKNLVSKADLFPAKANLKANSSSSVKSGATGFISLLFGLAFLAYLSTRLVQAFQLKQVKSQFAIQALERSQTKANFTTFGISVEFLPLQTVEQMFTFYLWVYKKGQYHEKLQMKPCVAEDWAELGENFKQQFMEREMDKMFCPVTKDKFYMKQIFGDDKPDYINFQLYKCNPDTSAKCKPKTMQDYLRNQTINERGFTVFVYILDTIIYQERYDGIQPHLNTNTKARIREDTGEELFIQFATFNMSTDISIFPLKYLNTTEGSHVDNVRSTQIKIDNLTNALDEFNKEHNISTTSNSTATVLGASGPSELGSTDAVDNSTADNSTTNATSEEDGQIHLPQDEPLVSIFFTMNEKITVYDRSVKKITEYLAEFGGFASIVMAVVGFFIAGYNAHKYQLGVADKAFKQDERKMKADDFNLLTYAKFTIYTYSNKILGKKPNWEDCKKLEYTKKESGGLMQIDSIFKRLQTLETMVRYSTDRHEMKVIRLVEPLSIREAEEERLTLAYYAKVVKKGTYAPTIRDMRHTYDLREASLEELCIPSASGSKSSAKGGSEEGEIRLDSPSVFSPSSSVDMLFSKMLNNETDDVKSSQKNSKSLKTNRDSKDGAKQTKDGDIQLLRRCIDQFKEIKEEAGNVKLNSKMKKIQLSLAKSFSKIKPETRAKMQERMPIIVLHRLFIALDQYKLGKKAKKDEKKNEQEKMKTASIEVKGDKAGKEDKKDAKGQEKGLKRKNSDESKLFGSSQNKHGNDQDEVEGDDDQEDFNDDDKENDEEEDGKDDDEDDKDDDDDEDGDDNKKNKSKGKENKKQAKKKEKRPKEKSKPKPEQRPKQKSKPKQKAAQKQKSPQKGSKKQRPKTEERRKSKAEEVLGKFFGLK